MRFSNAIAYAINAMLQLADTEPGVPISCRQLASADEMPERFLLQVLRTLVNHGVLRSTRGVDGGYYLARPSRDITLCDILDPFENPLEPKMPKFYCPSSATRDRVYSTLRHAGAVARAELEKMSLAELVDRGDGKMDMPEKLKVS